MFKALYALLLGEYLDKKGRESLIRWEEEFGVVMAVSYSGVKLTLYLHMESSRCYYQLEYGGKKFKKYLSDDYQALLKVANFHYFKDEKFSLNRYITKTTLPFTHTSGTLNYRILDSASEVPQIKKALVELDEKLAIIKDDRQLIERKIMSLQEQFKLMDDSGIDLVKNRLNYINTNYTNYKSLTPFIPTLDTIVNSQQTINGLELNDYGYAEDILPQLNLLSQSVDSLDKVNQSIVGYENLLKTTQPKPVALEPLLNDMRNMEDSVSRLRNIENSVTELNKIKVEPVLNVTPLIEVTNKLNALTETVTNTGEINKQLIDIKVEPVVNLQPMFNFIHGLKEIDIRLIQHTKYQHEQEELNQVDVVDIVLTDNLFNQINNFKQVHETLGTILSDIETIQTAKTKLVGLDSELTELTKQIGICTKCGQKLSEHRHHQEVM